MKKVDTEHLSGKARLKKLIKQSRIARGIFYPIFAIKRKSLQKKTEIQYQVINNLQDLLIEQPVILIEEFNGKFSIDCRSDLFKRIVINKFYEPTLVKYCNNLIDKNRDAIDVGANVGFFTVLFAKTLKNRKVLSIEPTNRALSKLYKNILLNAVQNNVVVFEGAVTNGIGEVEIKTIEGREEYSSIGVTSYISPEKNKILVEKVATSTIDNLTKQYSLDPGFIKVDVEGVEHLVFDGARKTLLKNRPIILSELCDKFLRQNGSSARDVVNLIKEYNYDVINPDAPNTPLIFEDINNILCIPKEKK